MINQLNLGQALGQGAALGTVMQRSAQDRELQNVFAQHGPGIMQGNPQALNALAAVDPVQAFQLQRQAAADKRAIAADTRGAKLDDLRTMQILSQMSAADRAKAAEELQRGLSGAAFFYSKGDKAGYEAFLAENQLDPAQYPFEQFPAHAAQFEGVLEALSSFEPDDPADEYGRYAAEERAAGREPLSRIDFKRAGQKSMRVVSDGAGGVTVEETFGGNAGAPKITEGGLAAAGYLSRMRAAEEVLDELSKDGPATLSLWSRMASGTDFEGYALSPQQQRVLQASRDWVRAKLRKESGAVIGPEEMAEEIRTYFPMPGEDKATIEQKRQARKEAERQFEIMSGGAASLADTTTEEVSSGSPGPGDQIDLPPDLQALFDQYPAPAGR